LGVTANNIAKPGHRPATSAAIATIGSGVIADPGSVSCAATPRRARIPRRTGNPNERRDQRPGLFRGSRLAGGAVAYTRKRSVSACRPTPAWVEHETANPVLGSDPDRSRRRPGVGFQKDGVVSQTVNGTHARASARFRLATFPERRRFCRPRTAICSARPTPRASRSPARSAAS